MIQVLAGQSVKYIHCGSFTRTVLDLYINIYIYILMKHITDKVKISFWHWIN